MNQIVLDGRTPPPLFDAADVLGTIWKRRMLVLVVTCVVIFAAGLYVAVTKPTYTADAAILVDPRDAKTTNMESVLPGIGSDSAAIASQVSVIESRELLNSVFDQLGLADDPEFADSGTMSSLIGLVKKVAPPSRDAVFEAFQSKLSVEREGLTYVIDVKFKSRDAEKAARIVNAVVDRYNASQTSEKSDANQEVSSVLTGKIAGLQTAVSDAERAVEDFKSQHNIFDVNTGGTLQSQIDQLSTQILAAKDQANQTEARYDQAVSAGTTPQGLIKLSDISSSATTDKLRDDYNQKAAALANAQALYGPRHPTIISLQAELNKVETLMGREAERIIQELKATRDLAASNLQKLQAGLAALRQQSSQSDLAQVQLRQLQRQADSARAVLDDFMHRSQETSQMSGLQTSQIRVISAAVPPAEATWPKPMLILPVSLLLGFMAGCGLALMLGRAEIQPVRAPIAPQPVPPTPDKRNSKSGLDLMGKFRLPANAGEKSRGALQRARLEITASAETAMGASVQLLLRDVFARLSGGEKPFVLLTTSVRTTTESQAAAHLLAVGLQHVGAAVLMIDVAPAERKTNMLRPLASAYAHEPVIDPTSGVPTISVTSDRLEGDTSAALAKILREAGGHPDFVVIAGRALSEPAYKAALAERADLELFALSAADEQSGAALWLKERLGGADTSHKAALVIDMPGQPESKSFKPRLVVANDDIRPAAAAS